MLRGVIVSGLVSVALLACGGAPAHIEADGGEPDAEFTPDANVADSRSADTSAVDAGPPRADVPFIACNDALNDVYKTPPNLPPMTLASRGDVIRCAHDVDWSLTDVQARISSKGVQTPATTGTSLYRVEFRTTRGDGTAGTSTARVYLPKKPRALPLPVIVIGHPTDGIAPSCTPSKDLSSNNELALPWAALGYAVIVPDYSGLGNEGVQSYLDNRDQAYSLLDGARALRKLLSPGALNPQVLAVGYSQGGGAVLSAQALAGQYGCDGKLQAAIVFAPEWPSRLNSFGYVDMLRNPGDLTISAGIGKPVVAEMRQYAYFANHAGLNHAGDAFPAAKAAGMSNAIATLCQTPLGGYVQGNALHLGDLIDDSLRTGLLSCIDGNACSGDAKDYFDYLQNNFVTADKSGAPVLFIQGLADQIMVPYQEAACNLDKLSKEGVNAQVCADFSATHTSVVGRNADFAIAWGQAVLSGGARPSCSSFGMPPCSP